MTNHEALEAIALAEYNQAHEKLANENTPENLTAFRQAELVYLNEKLSTVVDVRSRFSLHEFDPTRDDHQIYLKSLTGGIDAYERVIATKRVTLATMR